MIHNYIATIMYYNCLETSIQPARSFTLKSMCLWTVVISCGIIWYIPKAKCNPCYIDCRTCTYDGEVQICTSCNDGYWLHGSSCLLCHNNCATCSNASSCSTCKPGFYSPTSLCISQCPTQCLGRLCDEIRGYCTECPSDRYGYHCEFECKLCKHEQCDLRQCTNGCKSGYWQYQNGNYIECKPCADKCVSCVNGSICNVCKDGTYLSSYSETRNYCVLCPPTCDQCSIINSCSACKPGYYGTACEFVCSARITGCQLCDWQGVLTVTCNQCDNSWTLQDNTCVEVPHQCPINCERCSGDNVCATCMTGWVGELCDETCHHIQHCVACHKTGGSIACNVCDEGYEVMNGECNTTSTNTKSVQSIFTPFSKASTKKTSSRPTLTTPTIESIVTSTISEPPVSGYSNPMSETQNTRFQTSAFVIGLVTGIGICICAVLLTVLIWFLRRRKRLQKPTTSRQNEPFYENSFAASESHLKTMTPDGPNQENIQQMRVVEENESEPVEDTHQTPIGGENVSTSTNIDQYDYTSLNIRHGEHIYKDLTAL